MRLYEHVRRLRDAGLTRDQIAERLGISRGTVNSTLARYVDPVRRAAWAAEQRAYQRARRLRDAARRRKGAGA